MLKKPLSWFKGREERKETGLEALLACGTTLKEVGPGVGAWAQDCCLVGLFFFFAGGRLEVSLILIPQGFCFILSASSGMTV
jgi:hypothetical protein